MGLITGTIGQQSFEIVRDRIGAILFDELRDQYYLTGEDEYNPDVWSERIVPFDAATELPAINVSLSKGDYSNQDVSQVDGTYFYDIDVYTKGNGVNGDVLAKTRLHRILGLCRAIIMNPIYKTLGFDSPFIMNRHFENIMIADPKKEDESLNTVMGRLVLSVKVPETTNTLDTTLIGSHYTTINLHETSKGYLYIYDDYES